MDFELAITGAILVIFFSALFVWQSLPPWIVAVLAFAFAMYDGSEVLGMRWREPYSSRESCVWRCDARYGHRAELAPINTLCCNTCP